MVLSGTTYLQKKFLLFSKSDFSYIGLNTILLFIGYRFVFFVCFRTDGDAWQGLKAPTVHHDQRSKFRQQTAPYIRPN